MADVSIAEAKARFSEIVAAAEGGKTQMITRRGKPVAKIVPAEALIVGIRRDIDVDALRQHIAHLTKDGAPIADADEFMARWDSEQRF
jgi:prevent-host-death family protein